MFVLPVFPPKYKAEVELDIFCAPPPPPRAVAKSATSVHDEPFQDSVKADAAAGVVDIILPPKTKPSVVEPLP